MEGYASQPSPEPSLPYTETSDGFTRGGQHTAEYRGSPTISHTEASQIELKTVGYSSTSSQQRFNQQLARAAHTQATIEGVRNTLGAW